MSVSAHLYGHFLIHALKKEMQLLTDSLNVTLHTSGYVPAQDTDEHVSDLTNEVAAGGGYSTGGQVLGSPTLTYTAGGHLITFSGASVTWTASTITARVVVLSDRTPSGAANQPLLFYALSTVDVISSGGDFDVIWNASGIFTITNS